MQYKDLSSLDLLNLGVCHLFFLLAPFVPSIISSWSVIIMKLSL